MGSQLNREKLCDGVYFSSITDPKFKHNRISIHVLLPLEKEYASQRAVVPFVLRKGYKQCADFTELNKKLSRLYGATLDGEASKIGGYQMLELSIRGLDDRYAIEPEALTQTMAEMLIGVVLDPNFEDDIFTTKDVELEKQYIIDTIEAEINDKRSYAISKCKSIMCKDEPIAVKRYGSLETAKNITARSATEAYRRAICIGAIEVMFTGSGNPEPAKKLIGNAFAAIKRTPISPITLNLKTTATTVKEVVEEMDVSQSKLVMGFRTGEIKTERELIAMRLMVGLYGATPFSKLFQNVREKLSLCYYCAARFDRLTKLLMVDSGIQGENRQKAVDEIKAQLVAIQNGEITDEELSSTKLLMQNSLRSVTDSLTAIEDWYITQIIAGSSNSPEQEAAMIEQITKQDIIYAAKQVTLDTIYLLKGKEEGVE